jgi:hypothetical protein
MQQAHMNERLAKLILGGLPREQKILKGHLPRAMHHQVYTFIQSQFAVSGK